MFASSRPYSHMPALSSFRTPAARLLAVAAVLLPLAPPATASVHHAVAPVRRGAPPVRFAHAETHGRTAAAKPAHAGRQQTHVDARHTSRVAPAEAEVETAPGKKHGRDTSAKLAAPVHGRRDTRTGSEEAAAPPLHARGPAVAARHIPLNTADVAADDTAAEPTADRKTRDRVHAWYKTHDTAPVSIATAHAAPPKPARSPQPAPAPDPTRTPDLATSAPKATAADFDKAAAAQRFTIRSAAEQNSRQTTAADDAADAESQIPSTAPTEREPSPFIHGEDPSQPAHSSRRPAPVVRQRPADPVVAATAEDDTLDLSPPAAARATPLPRSAARADLQVPTIVAAKPVAATQKPVTDAKALAAIPVASAGDSSSRAMRAVAAETASSPTPRLQLPSPPAAGRRPAIAAIQTGTRTPVLDPAISAGMADETFDGDNTPATTGTAIRLATTGPAAKARPHNDADYTPVSAVVPVNILDGAGHLLLLPPMKGSHEILVHQNQMALSDGLERIQNDRQLADMRRLKLLVDLPDDDSMYPNDVLPQNRRFARPWTVRFLRDMARSHYARFGTPLIVTSAVRTVEFQRRLVRVNGNAAPPTGDIASPHLYGQAVDIAKSGMSLTEITWMRAYLAPVEDDGKIDVEEEFQQPCFHISVYRRYLGAPPTKQKPAPPALLQAKASAPPEAPEKRHHLPAALLATHLP